jgi:hypothetical protein
LGLASTAQGQEALRESLAGEQAARARKAALENRDYNLKLGRLNLNFSSSFSAEYNDSISLSSIPEDDFILRPGITTSGHLPVSDQNALSFSLGVGYLKYLDHTEFDRFQITPGTELAFDVFVDNFRFTVFDRFSYSIDPVTESTVTDSADLGGFSNLSGINAIWDLNRIVLTAGYGHRIATSHASQFSNSDRTVDLFLVRAGYQVHGALTLGIESSLNLTDYDQPIFYDSTAFSIGPFAEWQVSEKIRALLRGGYVRHNFDAPPGIGSMEDEATFYLTAVIDWTINQYVHAGFQLDHDAQASTDSNYRELLTARLHLRWNIIQNLGLTTYGVYESGFQPEFVRINEGEVFFRAEEDWERFGVGIALSYPLMRRLGASLSYRYYLRNSDLAEREYRQNSVALGLTYRF